MSDDFDYVSVGTVHIKTLYCVEWRSIDTAPKDRFILLYCPEDDSRWWAKWQELRWHGVDEYGLTREGHSEGDPEVVTGWAVTHWMPIPMPPGDKR